ncbi:MAG TPA: mechanosensitive ion channel [Nitrospinaceae bacterium]|nr:mechanosensitive ion channel [Nitrospinaceae bacterium]
MTNLLNTIGIDQVLTNLNSKTLSNFDREQAEGIAKGLFSEYGWIFLAGLIALLVKDIMINLVKGIMIFYGHDFDNDDVIYISGRQARIVRVGVTSTTFYMSDRKTKMVVPNEQLKELTIEKTLPKNGGKPYLSSGGDPDFVELTEVTVTDLKELRENQRK